MSSKNTKGSQKSLGSTKQLNKKQEEEVQQEQKEEEPAPQVQQVQQSGFGRFEYRNGIIYEGQWQLFDGVKMKHGEGTLIITVGNMSYETGNEEYRGSWEKDKMNGYGTYLYTSGAKYTGEWKDGQHHGKGIYEFSDGTLYEGEWRDHKMHGEGYYIDKNGQKWEGEFVEGVFQSKMQKELKTEKMLKAKEKEIFSTAVQFFSKFKAAFEKSDKKTFKENLTPFFSNPDEVKLYVQEPYPKFEEKQPQIWADAIEFCSQYTFSNVLRQVSSAKIIDPNLIQAQQFQGVGQIVEFKREQEDRTVQLVIVNKQNDEYTIVYFHDTYVPETKGKK